MLAPEGSQSAFPSASALPLTISKYLAVASSLKVICNRCAILSPVLITSFHPHQRMHHGFNLCAIHHIVTKAGAQGLVERRLHHHALLNVVQHGSSNRYILIIAFILNTAGMHGVSDI